VGQLLSQMRSVSQTRRAEQPLSQRRLVEQPLSQRRIVEQTMSRHTNIHTDSAEGSNRTRERGGSNSRSKSPPPSAPVDVTPADRWVEAPDTVTPADRRWGEAPDTVTPADRRWGEAPATATPADRRWGEAPATATPADRRSSSRRETHLQTTETTTSALLSRREEDRPDPGPATRGHVEADRGRPLAQRSSSSSSSGDSSSSSSSGGSEEDSVESDRPTRTSETPTSQQSRPRNYAHSALRRAPVLLRPLADTRALPGSVVHLRMLVDALPVPSAAWYRDGWPLREGSDALYRITTDNGVCTLTLQDVTPDEAGRYRCEADNTLGSVASEAVLFVPGEI